jgi:hypothetical protein
MTRHPTTEDLIDDLARRRPPPPFLPDRVATIVVTSVVAAVLSFWLTFGMRPDLPAALAAPIMLIKLALPLSLAALALWLALASARPGARAPAALLFIPATVALFLFGWRSAAVPDGQLWSELVGQTAAACLVSISTLALLPIGLGLAALRHGAPTQPVLSGALMGLASGAGVAAGYALHCTQDSPLFFVTWYGLAMVITTTFGAIAGDRFLRW